MTVLELQRSAYGPQHYLNLGLWFLELGVTKHPRVEKCHVYGRYENLTVEALSESLQSLLDLTTPLDADARCSALKDLLSEVGTELLTWQQASDIMESPAGERLMSIALISDDAYHLFPDLED